MNDDNILIVITDEVGSTDRDCLANTKEKILNPRIEYFREQINRLPTGASIVKSVGDSLVITCKNDLIPAVVKSVFDSWRKINNGRKGFKIRTIVHKTRDKKYWTKGDGIFKELKKISNIRSKWKYYENVKEDIFGLEMNLVARIASLPSSNSFVVTESVFFKNGNNIDQTLFNEIKSYLSLKNYEVGPSIPIAHLKGFNKHLDLYPIKRKKTISILEVIPEREINFIHKKNNSDFLYDDLIFDSKEYQVIRTLYLKGRYKDNKNRINEAVLLLEDIKLIKEEILNFAKDESNKLNYFIDFMFDIQNVWEGFNINISRKFNAVRKSKIFKCVKFSNLKPIYLMFNNSFDEKNDNIIAQKIENFQLNPVENKSGAGKLEAKILTESTKVFERCCWLNKDLKLKNYWLLLFQVNSDFYEDPDNPLIFITLLNNLINDMNIVSLGLLKGTFDGYILFQQSDNRNEREVVNGFNLFFSNKIEEDNYQFIIIPNYLYSLKFNDIKDFLDQSNVETVIRNLKFKNFNTWKNFIEMR